MRDGIAAAIASLLLLMLLSACGDRNKTSAAGDNEEMMDQLLSPARSAKIDACLAQAVTPPWHLVRTQPFVGHLSVTIEARSADLGLPHRPTQMRRQQYVEIGIGRGSHFPVPSAADLQSQISQGWLEPRADVEGIPAAAFAPFVPYARTDTTLFLNLSADEHCRYRAADKDFPNPFVECQAKRGEYTVSLTFPHDAIAHLPRVFAAVRPLMTQVISCFDLTKEL
jgi:hypothetical protein